MAWRRFGVRLPVGPPRARTPTGRGHRLKPGSVRVRIPRGSPMGISAVVAHTLRERGVVGSSPTSPTMQVWRNGRRAGLRSQWGNPWEFESLYLHHRPVAGTADASVSKTDVHKTCGFESHRAYHSSGCVTTRYDGRNADQARVPARRRLLRAI